MTRRLASPALVRNDKTLDLPSQISSTAFAGVRKRRGEARTGSDMIQIPEC